MYRQPLIFSLMVVSYLLLNAPFSINAAEPRFSCTTDDHGTLEDGTKVKIFTIKNPAGAFAKISEFGATVTELHVPNQQGKLVNVVLAPTSLAELAKGFPAASIIGRFANRIKGAEITLDGKSYPLTKNSGKENHIHGGNKNFSRLSWKGEATCSQDHAQVKLNYTAKDLEEGFPGNLQITVTYTLDKSNSLTIDYYAVSDKTTVINVTNHAYFNLSGDHSKDVLNHEAVIYADEYVEADGQGFPTGKINLVDQSAFDFRKPKSLGKDISQLKPTPGGYDHCYVVRGKAGELNLAAEVKSADSGITLKCFTTEPGFQLYTANNQSRFNGMPYPVHAAFCLETQHYPDSPHFPHFPSTILKAGDTFKSQTIFKFEISK